MYNKGDSLRLDRRLVPTIYNIFVLYSAHQVKSFCAHLETKFSQLLTGLQLVCVYVCVCILKIFIATVYSQNLADTSEIE